ncbi:nucleotidyltransferase family protein [Streptomyces sp. NPDC059396]|uniref:nucleotidyltransferase family protein n=1 Tax=Streptomyces sp. NPDC059396 TaxID=3346819 RepID=UPI0036C0700E
MSDPAVDDLLVHSRLGGLRPEGKLLLALARPGLTVTEQDRIHRFLSHRGRFLDWGFILDQASRHGILPIIGRNLTKYRLVHLDDGRTLAPYRWIYYYAYDGNRRRNIALGDEYAKVIRALNVARLDYVIRKGPVLTEGIYRDAGLRRMGDLDVLIHSESFSEFSSIVEKLGYQQGHLTRNAEQVVSFDRRTRLTWKVNLPNSTLPYLKPAQRDDVEVFVLDPCFSLFQPRSGIPADAGDFLAGAVDTTAFGEPSRMLDPVDQIIDVCVQLHVEATTLLYIEIGKDLTILKFLDLVELLRRLSDEQLRAFTERVEKFGCGDSVRYALHYTSQVFPDDISPSLIDEFGPPDPDLLEVYGALDGKSERWEKSFADRLFEQRRWESLKAHSTVPGPRAVV